MFLLCFITLEFVLIVCFRHPFARFAENDFQYIFTKRLSRIGVFGNNSRETQQQRSTNEFF